MRGWKMYCSGGKSLMLRLLKLTNAQRTQIETQAILAALKAMRF